MYNEDIFAYILMELNIHEMFPGFDEDTTFHQISRLKFQIADKVPNKTDKSYVEFWNCLIKKSKIAYLVINEPSEEMTNLHKMLWEV